MARDAEAGAAAEADDDAGAAAEADDDAGAAAEANDDAGAAAAVVLTFAALQTKSTKQADLSVKLVCFAVLESENYI